jgi:hypothetical protein
MLRDNGEYAALSTQGGLSSPLMLYCTLAVTLSLHTAAQAFVSTRREKFFLVN